MKKIVFLFLTSAASSFGMTMNEVENKTVIPNLDDIETFSQAPWKELIDTYHNDNKPLMVARVESYHTKQPYFYDAQELHKAFKDNKNGVFKPSNTYKNPLDSLSITKIDYYEITKVTNENNSNSTLVSTRIASYDEFADPVTRWNKLFPANSMNISRANTHSTNTETRQPFINNGPCVFTERPLCGYKTWVGNLVWLACCIPFCTFSCIAAPTRDTIFLPCDQNENPPVFYPYTKAVGYFWTCRKYGNCNQPGYAGLDHPLEGTDPQSEHNN